MIKFWLAPPKVRPVRRAPHGASCCIAVNAAPARRMKSGEGGEVRTISHGKGYRP